MIENADFYKPVLSKIMTTPNNARNIIDRVHIAKQTQKSTSDTSWRFCNTSRKCSIRVLDTLELITPKNIIFGHLNINLVRNNFDILSYITNGKIDFLMISESKQDDTFPTQQLLYSLFDILFTVEQNCILPWLIKIN